MPQELINAKPVSAAIKEFFGSSQLSQFMDQNNPLSEVTHKRRVSALGPGGLARERAGFEVRDVHPTHYGRVCPIETPEGPNIGLINSLAVYARTNSTVSGDPVPQGGGRQRHRRDQLSVGHRGGQLRHRPGQRLARRRRTPDRCPGLLPAPERVHPQGPGGGPVHGRLPAPDRLGCRLADPVPGARRRQPCPHGLEHAAPGGAYAACREATGGHGHGAGRGEGFGRHRGRPARRPGGVGGRRSHRGAGHDEERSRHRTSPVWISTTSPSTRVPTRTPASTSGPWCSGDDIGRGDVLADGPSTDMGELALGQNLRVAFMPWNGYNFEDSILISERVVQEDRFTSIHIEELTCLARDTKLGPRRSPAISPTSASRPCPSSTSPASSTWAPRCATATSWWARSRPRARPSSPRKRSCCGPSSARRPRT